MKLIPIKDSIIFEFIDTIADGAFATRTQSGIILNNKNSDDNAKTPRWAKVYAIGPDVLDIKVGEYILIAPLRWTLSFKLESQQLCKTIEKEVLLVADADTEVSSLFL